ncbi:MAG: type III pantothenate kinase, partial [Myxococcales bacterium]|nr:type III pantothenate kinase [Myxococcales bacterium]
MLLAVDVGNTHTVIGLFDGPKLVHDFRIESSPGRTIDELHVLLLNLLQVVDVPRDAIQAAILASVVPSLSDTVIEAVDRAFDLDMRVVGPGMKTGMPILYENP